MNLEGKKFALLIGVSECNSGFKSLRCPPNGIEALRAILTNPDIGGFSADQVVTLLNPSVSRMQAAIGKLFSSCSHRDLVLLYFTGHGVTDEKGDFFFTTIETLKQQNGSLNRGTAVAAGFVRNEMLRCFSRRQVVILDCCFSGAFPDGVLAMDDQSITIEQQLGGEGRAILTAATSTQYALEQEGEELSVYTRYLVRGLGTGAAVLNDQELIRIGDLHNYIRDQLRTAAAAMSPQIYAAQEGREIILAKALTDVELRYRKLVQKYLQPDGQFSTLGQRLLKQHATQWELSMEQVERIIQEITQPFQERRINLEEYASAFQAEVDKCYPISEQSRGELHDYQQILNLRDEDVAPIHAQIEAQHTLPPDSDPSLTPPNPKPPDPDPLPGGQKKILLWGTAVVAAVVAAASLPSIISPRPNPDPTQTSTETPSNFKLKPVASLISAGDNKDLYGSRTSQLGNDDAEQKKKGIEAFAKRDYQASLKIFSEILDHRTGNSNGASDPRKDPEISIFKNNSQARLNFRNGTGSPIYTIAVAMPLSDADGKPTIDIGQRTLFGVAQAQAKALAATSRINLEVIIANDLNRPDQAQKLAEALSASPITGSDQQPREILAVIGHYSSTVTCAALPTYNKVGLAIISPTSTKTDLRASCDGKKVFFRTISSSALEARALADYVSKSGVKNPKVAAFYKKGEGFSQDLFDQFNNNLGNIEISQFDLSSLSDVERGKNKLNDFNILAVFPDGSTDDNTAFERAINLIDAIKSGGVNRLILGSNPLNHIKIANISRDNQP